MLVPIYQITRRHIPDDRNGGFISAGRKGPDPSPRSPVSRVTPRYSAYNESRIEIARCDVIKHTVMHFLPVAAMPLILLAIKHKQRQVLCVGS
jgi:hypothetical protein